MRSSREGREGTTTGASKLGQEVRNLKPQGVADPRQRPDGHVKHDGSVSMAVLLVAIFLGAYRNAPPIYLAVGFIGEIILGATVHLSEVLQGHTGTRQPVPRA